MAETKKRRSAAKKPQVDVEPSGALNAPQTGAQAAGASYPPEGATVFSKELIPEALSAQDAPRFRKMPTTAAIEISEPFIVDTGIGLVEMPEGGMLALDARGYPYAIEREEFELVYAPAEGDDLDVEALREQVAGLQQRLDAQLARVAEIEREQELAAPVQAADETIGKVAAFVLERRWTITQDHTGRWLFLAVRPDGEVVTGRYDLPNRAATAARQHAAGKVWDR